jgi:Flp pilus assembly pilin Flp
MKTWEQPTGAGTMEALTRFIGDEEGFTGAEKAIFTLIAIGIILVIGKIIYDGTKSGATTTANQMNQNTAPNMAW